MSKFTITLEGAGGPLDTKIAHTNSEYVTLSELLADGDGGDWVLAAGDVIRIEVES